MAGGIAAGGADAALGAGAVAGGVGPAIGADAALGADVALGGGFSAPAEAITGATDLAGGGAGAGFDAPMSLGADVAGGGGPDAGGALSDSSASWGPHSADWATPGPGEMPTPDASFDPSGGGGGPMPSDATPMSSLDGGAGKGGLADSALGGISSLGGYGKVAGQALGVGGLAMQMMRGNQPPKTNRDIGGIAQSERKIGQTYLGLARANQVTPEMKAAEDQYRQNATNQLYQMYSAGGRDPRGNSDYLQGVQRVEQNVQIMHQKFVEQLFNDGMKAAGGASDALRYLADQELGRERDLSTAVMGAAKAMGGAGTTVNIGRA